jgi:methyl-accepting chemotaxis protein
MAAAVEHFKAEAIKKIKKKAQEEEDIKRWQQEDAERLAREQEAARQDQFAIDQLASGLSKLACGDLTYRISAAFAPKTEKLRLDFNRVVDRLQEALEGIRESANTIRRGSGEISSASDDLSRRTEEQAASLEETAAALHKITATVKNTARGALSAQAVVKSAKADADDSGKVVCKAIAAMDGIEGSSRRIGQIIGVIDEIAFQTNILALNAGVEAARAGDAGRGFAVIAAEVRDLAGRSAGAAKEIKSLISTSAAEVARGVALVGETSNALARIVAQVAEIDAAVSGIADGAQEQANALHQINTEVGHMDQMTQQNAAMAEETTAAAHMLNEQSDELARLVGQFQVDRESGDDLAGHVAGSIEPPPRPALRRIATQEGSGVLRTRPASGKEEIWENF